MLIMSLVLIMILTFVFIMILALVLFIAVLISMLVSMLIAVLAMIWNSIDTFCLIDRYTYISPVASFGQACPKLATGDM